MFDAGSLLVGHEIRGDATVMTACGVLDLVTAPELARALHRACEVAVPPRAVVADLRASSSSVRAIEILLDAGDACTRAGTPLCVVAVDRVVIRPIRLLGFDSSLRIVADMEAVSAVRSEAPNRGHQEQR